MLLFGGIALKPCAQTPAVNKPDALMIKVPAGSAPLQVAPAPYSSDVKVNYVRTHEAMAPLSNEPLFDTTGFIHVKQITEYQDGLGRLLQIVNRQATPANIPEDIVQPMTYDHYGMETFKYLPYVHKTGPADRVDGFKVNPFIAQDSFYRNQYRDAGNHLMYEGEEFFYSKTAFEASPLRRVNGTMAPGNSWVGSGRGKKEQQLINKMADSVRIWMLKDASLTYINGDSATLIPLSPAAYDEGQLYKDSRLDEQGSAVVQYENKEGQLILRKVQAGPVPAGWTGYDNWLCTYYVYDHLNQLRLVLPPKAVAAITAGWTLTPDVINELCFQYEYDQKGRTIASKVPGSGWVYMIYDRRDRLVFTQSATQRQRFEWEATLYDAMNRPLATGMLKCDLDRQSLQSYINGVPSTDETVTVTDLSPGGSLQVWMNPLPSGYSFTALTVTHYDGYDWTDRTYTDKYNSRLDAGDNPFPEALPDYAEQHMLSVRGMITGSSSRVLENPGDLTLGKWLSTVLYYDGRKKLIQMQRDNYGGGNQLEAIRYDFKGRVISRYLVHNNKLAGKSLATVTMKTTLNYDHEGRLESVWKIVNDKDATKTCILKNHFDALGILKTKEIGTKRNDDGSYSGEPIETLDYNYNIRGWLRGINASWSHPELNGGNAFKGDKWFGMELYYDWGSKDKNTDQHNGNISRLTWRSKGDGVRRALGFTYDPASRLLGADYSEHNNTGYIDNPSVNFDVVIGDGMTAGSAYDENGNIKRMKQWGLALQSSSVIDELEYGYYPHSNKLQAITDAADDQKKGNQKDFNDRNKTGYDYGYDLAGNLITDLNKGISGNTGINQTTEGAISYNHLQLPWLITVKDEGGNSKGTITYIYDAAGNKLQKRVLEYKTPANNNRQTEEVTTWLGDFVYEQVNGGSPILKSIAHEEGRIRLNCENVADSIWNYDYLITDHLGNVRMVLTDELETTSYPAASLETANLEKEKTFYKIPDDHGSRIHKNDVPGFPKDDKYTSPNDYIQRLNGRETRLGTSIVLRVMSGDRVNIRANSWYRQNGANNPGKQGLLEMLIPALSSGLTGTGAIGKVGSGNIGQHEVLSSAIAEFLTHQSNHSSGSSRPKAYLNWILLDEQLRPVITEDGKNSGFDQVGGDQEFKIHEIIGREINRNGYLYIYLSNESPGVDVFFDNLQVTHIKGPLLEETHYYPFGLAMAGISSRASKGDNYFENNKHYNGIEFNQELGLDIYDAFYRNLDPQIGRWWQIDPETAKMEAWSPYASMYDNPITFSDPLGNEPEDDDPPQNKILKSAFDGFMKGAEWINSNINPLTPLVELVTGTSYESNFTQPKPRLNSGLEAAISIIPVSKAASSVIKTLDKAVIVKGLEQAEGQIGKTLSKPSLKDKALELKTLNGGKNSITVNTPNKKIRFDFDGRSHGGVETPHKQIYIKNFHNGVLKSVTRENKRAEAMTQQELRTVKKYLEKLNKY